MNAPRLIVLTGGPGSGKTAILEVARKHFAHHVVVVEEAASIIYGGGFPRRESIAARRAAQRAIFRVQRELERLVIEEGSSPVALCDRGTVDGLAYWPDEAATFFREFDTTRESEVARYATVIHLRPPASGHGYDHANALRIESAAEAWRIDARIAEAWSGHPNRVVVPSTETFVEKLSRVMHLLESEVSFSTEAWALENPLAWMGRAAESARAPSSATET